MSFPYAESNTSFFHILLTVDQPSSIEKHFNLLLDFVTFRHMKTIVLCLEMLWGFL